MSYKNYSWQQIGPAAEAVSVQYSAVAEQVGGNHYKEMGDFQPVIVLSKWLSPEEYKGWAKGNAIVYLAREALKGGKVDMQKAAHSLAQYLELAEQAEQAAEAAGTKRHGYAMKANVIPALDANGKHLVLDFGGATCPYIKVPEGFPEHILQAVLAKLNA